MRFILSTQEPANMLFKGLKADSMPTSNEKDVISNHIYTKFVISQ